MSELQKQLEKLVTPYAERLEKVAVHAMRGEVYDEPNPNGKPLVTALAEFVEEKCAIASKVTGETSDGYHTFNELYHYRMLYNAAFFNELSPHLEQVHKSWKHSDGELCFGGGWFVVVAQLPTGQITNHYEAKWWELFNIPERETAAEWDGHTPHDVVKRLEVYLVREGK